MRYLLLLCLFLCGCDGGASYDTPGNPRPADPHPIVGVWRVRSVYSESTGRLDCPAVTPLVSCTADARLTFTDDGRFTDSQGDLHTYTINGTRLEYFGKPAATSISFQIQQNLMTWFVSGNGATYEMLMERL